MAKAVEGLKGEQLCMWCQGLSGVYSENGFTSGASASCTVRAGGARACNHSLKAVKSLQQTGASIA